MSNTGGANNVFLRCCHYYYRIICETFMCLRHQHFKLYRDRDLIIIHIYLLGPIPITFGNLVGLKGLLLNDNQLSGWIPAGEMCVCVCVLISEDTSL